MTSAHSLYYGVFCMSEVGNPNGVEKSPEVYEKRLVDLILEKDRLERKLCVVETEIEFTIKYLKNLRNNPS